MRFQKNGSNSAVVTTALTLLGLICLSAWAQIQTKQGSPASSQLPMATAGVHKTVLDSENRPITAGGTVQDGPHSPRAIAKDRTAVSAFGRASRKPRASQ